MTRRIPTKAFLAAAALGGLIVAAGCTKSVPTPTESVQVIPAKPLSPLEQAKESSLALQVLGHISDAQREIERKNIEGAKKDVAQALALLAMIRAMQPDAKIIDNMYDARYNLWFFNVAYVPLDLVHVTSSMDQLYQVLPNGPAKEHLKKAIEAVKNEKEKGVPKAKEEMDLAEESMAFRESDLSLSQVTRSVKLAQDDLEHGKVKEAGDALAWAWSGLKFFDVTIVDPIPLAARRIWLATQDYHNKNLTGAKAMLAKAKTSLEEVVKTGTKKQQDEAKHLIGQIDAIDVMKGGEQTDKAFGEIWQEAKKMAEQAPFQRS